VRDGTGQSQPDASIVIDSGPQASPTILAVAVRGSGGRDPRGRPCATAHAGTIANATAAGLDTGAAAAAHPGTGVYPCVDADPAATWLRRLRCASAALPKVVWLDCLPGAAPRAMPKPLRAA
jgi:hypothetical protein